MSLNYSLLLFRRFLTLFFVVVVIVALFSSFCVDVRNAFEHIFRFVSLLKVVDRNKEIRKTTT